MNHAENKNILSKMKEKLRKYSFLVCLLLTGIVFFNRTDQWQLYTEPLQETYTKGVQLVERLANGQWQELLGGQRDSRGGDNGICDRRACGFHSCCGSRGRNTEGSGLSHGG